MGRKKDTVAARWGLPPGTQHLALPYPLLSVLWKLVTASEFKIFCGVLIQRYPDNAGVWEVSVNKLSGQIKIDRRQCGRALERLSYLGVLDYNQSGQGKRPTVSLRPTHSLLTNPNARDFVAVRRAELKATRLATPAPKPTCDPSTQVSCDLNTHVLATPAPKCLRP